METAIFIARWSIYSSLICVHITKREFKHMKQLSLEVQIFESEMRLHNPSGLYSGPQNILLGGNIVGSSYPIQIIQITTQTNKRT